MFSKVNEPGTSICFAIMPSITHESLVALFRDCPALAPELVRGAGIALSGDFTPRITSAELVDLNPAEYRADVVVRLDKLGATAGVEHSNVEDRTTVAEAIIVEVQLNRDPGKRKSWPCYMAGVHARLDCLVTLLVIAMDRGVADWCAHPIVLDHNGSTIHPLVLGPQTLPRIKDFEQARKLPELAVLSAAAHGGDEDAAAIALAGVNACRGLDSQRGNRYHDFIMASLSEAARSALEKLMSAQGYQYQSEFAKKYVGEGLERGREQGLRDILLRLLVQRFGSVPESTRERVEQAKLDELDRWLDNVIPAATLADVFKPK